MCDPDSWIQGHAVWHLFGTLSIYLLFLFYRDLLSPKTEPA